MKKLSGAVFAFALCLASTMAHANGRLPGATGLAIHPSDDRQLLLGLSYGLALSRDRGASWSWMCEEQIEGNGGDVDPSIIVTGDGSLVVLSLTNGGVLVSRDEGCSFERAMGPLQGNRGVDLTLDPTQPGRVLALMSTIYDEVDRRPLYRNLLAHSLDHGKSWSVLAELPQDMSAETVEVAPADDKRIYVTGTASANPLQGIIERSDDGGLSWTRTTVQLPRGSGSLFLSGIHPTDPNRLWARVPGLGDVYGVLPARLWVSTDGAASFKEVAATRGGMLGFALSPDGSRVVYGGPLDGLFVAPADGTAAPSKVSDLQVRCLRWLASGLYACAGEPTDPYSLGYTTDPMQGFVPLFHRADTCRAACAPTAPLELTCREPWEAVAPLVGAHTAVCGGTPVTPDAGTDAGSGALGTKLDGGGGLPVDASPAAPDATTTRARSAHGCVVMFSSRDSAPWWTSLALLAIGLGRPRRDQRRPSRRQI